MLLKKISLQNFKCYRKKTIFDIENATFMVGPNNSGKSAVLTAVRCFFDDNEFLPIFINRTEFASKKKSYNKSVIIIEFEIGQINQKVFRTNLVKSYGK